MDTIKINKGPVRRRKNHFKGRRDSSSTITMILKVKEDGTQGQHLNLADTTSKCRGYNDGTCLATIRQDDFNLDNRYGSPGQNIVPMSAGNSFGEHRP
ncbi:hypothetical protein LEMLEM_LOCUS22494, partial [Lemmus lemmus]